jgi:polygalacturonase
VELTARLPIKRSRVFPEARIGSVLATGSRLTVELPAPDSLVVWIDELPPLLMLVDRLDDVSEADGAASTVTVTDLGADPTGTTSSTVALQAAIDRATESGAVCRVPAGRFLTGTLRLSSGTSLFLAPGALVAGSENPRDYPLDPGRTESASDESLAPDRRFLGRTMTFSRLLLIDRAEGVRIWGQGTIDGSGTHLRTQHGAAPNLLRIRESRNVDVSGVLFRNAAAWSLHVLASRDVRIHDLAVINDRENLNTDGIDPDMSRDVTIERCSIYTKDDGVCVKATGNSDLHGDPERILVRHCLVSSRDAALKVGTESEAERFRDIHFEDCAVFDSGRAMSVVVRDGAVYEDIVFRDIDVGPRVDHLVEQVVGAREPEARLGSVRHLQFERVRAPEFEPPASNWTWYAQFRPDRHSADDRVPVFAGADETHAVDELTLRDVVVGGQRLVDADSAERIAGITFGENVRNVRFE